MHPFRTDRPRSVFERTKTGGVDSPPRMKFRLDPVNGLGNCYAWKCSEILFKKRQDEESVERLCREISLDEGSLRPI